MQQQQISNEKKDDGALYKLIGIVFVIHTPSGGVQLIFRYPTVIRDKVSKETMSAFNSIRHSIDKSDENENDGAFSKLSNWQMVDAEETKQQEELQQHPSYNLPSVILGPLLVPKSRLLNKNFRMELDSTVYIGFPVNITKDKEKEKEKEKEREKEKEKEKEKEREREKDKNSPYTSADSTTSTMTANTTNTINTTTTLNSATNFMKFEERSQTPIVKSLESTPTLARQSFETAISKSTDPVTIPISMKRGSDTPTSQMHGGKTNTDATLPPHLKNREFLSPITREYMSPLSTEEVSPSTSPTSRNTNSTDTPENKEKEKREKKKTRSELIGFNVCFALGRVDSGMAINLTSNSPQNNSSGSGQIQSTTTTPSAAATAKEYSRVGTQLAQILKHEQLRSKYLGDQSYKLLEVREAWLNAQREEANSNTRPDHRALTSQLLSISSLARELRDIYTNLRNQGTTNVRVNGWIGFVASLAGNESVPRPLSSKINSDQNAIMKLILQPLRPYQTILILPKTRASLLPPDAHPHLHKIFEQAKPTKSFRELSLELEIPLPQLWRCAAHLQYWGCARIINAITKSNEYIVNPALRSSEYWLNLNANMNTPFGSRGDYFIPKANECTLYTHFGGLDSKTMWRGVTKEFTRTFPSFRLDDILERFSNVKTIGQQVVGMLTSVQKDLIAVTSWMLQRNLLVQLQTYPFLAIPNATISRPLSVTVSHSTNSTTNSNSTTTTINQSDPKAWDFGLNDMERAHINSLPQSPFLNNFKKVCRHFRGNQSLEEVMWLESLSRDDMNSLLDHFKDILTIVKY